MTRAQLDKKMAEDKLKDEARRDEAAAQSKPDVFERLPSQVILPRFRPGFCSALVSTQRNLVQCGGLTVAACFVQTNRRAGMSQADKEEDKVRSLEEMAEGACGSLALSACRCAFLAPHSACHSRASLPVARELLASNLWWEKTRSAR